MRTGTNRDGIDMTRRALDDDEDSLGDSDDGGDDAQSVRLGSLIPSSFDGSSQELPPLPPPLPPSRFRNASANPCIRESGSCKSQAWNAWWPMPIGWRCS